MDDSTLTKMGRQRVGPRGARRMAMAREARKRILAGEEPLFGADGRAYLFVVAGKDGKYRGRYVFPRN